MPWSSGNSPTRSDIKSTLQIDEAISILSLLIKKSSEINDDNFLIR